MNDEAEGVALVMVQPFCPFCWAALSELSPRTPSATFRVMPCPAENCAKPIKVRFWRRVDD